MSKQEAATMLSQFLKKQKALEIETLENNANIRALIYMMYPDDDCNIQADNLDIALVSVEGPSAQLPENDHDDDGQKVDTLELLGQMESAETLLGEECIVPNEDLSIDEDVATESIPKAEKFMFYLYTDPLVIAAEASWWRASETAAECSDPTAELTEEKPRETHEDVLTVGKEASEQVAPECPGTEAQFMYDLYTDEAVITAEISWWKSQEAISQCSSFQYELVEADQKAESPVSCGTSVTSGSRRKTRKRKTYQPPAKGTSPRLTQEQINFISLQRSRK
ncbi:hypothetical protein HDU77_005223 [Chytriomyces hyalinus]|nr:hypothetical protein HDU77_005223 [Chytriomyces hyalinus]